MAYSSWEEERGLSQKQVELNQKLYGLNIIHQKNFGLFSILARQFTGNPLIFILILATFISSLLGEVVSSLYILAIIMLSVFLGFWNEFSAQKTVEVLLKKITPSALVLRSGEKKEVSVINLTLGDLVVLSQGSIVPADLHLIKSNDLEVDESVLTGESKSVRKKVGDTSFMGTNIINGSGRGVVMAIGNKAQFGQIAQSVSFIKPVTEFQKGLTNFGQLIVRVVLLLTLGIFVFNFLLGRPLIEALLFALAIAVGLTPELLPLVVTVSLSHGAGRLAKKHVVTKKLVSIENLGNMDVLCSDKTGTLTEGKIEVVNFINTQGEKETHVIELALLCNSALVHHKVVGNPIDAAIWNYATNQKIHVPSGWIKIAEEPLDYNRQLMYTVVQKEEEILLIVKGSPEEVIGLCKKSVEEEKSRRRFMEISSQGLRVIAVATKNVTLQKEYGWSDLFDLDFCGFIDFLDVPKNSSLEALKRLQHLNVLVKVITGDNEIITKRICEEVGLKDNKILMGKDIETMEEEKLQEAVSNYQIFARITPQQKLRIIQALQKSGHTVGYLGDGINDLLALEGADVGISVNTAVDVAKEAASIVLLQKGLNVIADGIVEGRKTFNNTIKYILMSTSSNFGNMFSAALASFFLPFLPMTPLQILLTNGLYDVSQLSIPTDNVDHESLKKPRHWNTDFIKSYMLFFGPLSSIYDLLTFGVMLFVFKAQSALFQTGWFIESVATEILVVFVIRTARTPFFKSRPGRFLIISCLGIVFISLLLPFTSLGSSFGFVAPPPLYFAVILILVVTYLFLVEMVKNRFLKRYSL